MPHEVEQLLSIHQNILVESGKLISHHLAKQLKEKQLIFRNETGEWTVTSNGEKWLQMSGLVEYK